MDSSFLGALPAAINAVGTDRFEKYLADAIGCVLRYDFITMARYSVQGSPQFLIHSHTFPSHMAELYLSRFVDADPYVEHWRMAEAPGAVWLQEIASVHKRYASYTRDFLPQIGVKDEIGVFMPAVGRDSVAFFYNNRRGLFAPDDIARVRRVFDASAALYRLHIRALLDQAAGGPVNGSPSLGVPHRLTNDTGATIWFTNEWTKQPPPDLTGFDAVTDTVDDPDSYRTTRSVKRQAAQELTDHDPWAYGLRAWLASLGLTPRERDITGLIVQGQDSLAVAAALQISLGNVKNHKRRIYAKLNLTSERDLFVRYIAAMSAMGQT